MFKNAIFRPFFLQERKSTDDFESIHVTKVPKIRPFCSCSFILSTCTLGMPPPYIKSSRKSKVVIARNTKKKLKFH